jgi:hypothetical protein
MYDVVRAHQTLRSHHNFLSPLFCSLSEGCLEWLLSLKSSKSRRRVLPPHLPSGQARVFYAMSIRSKAVSAEYFKSVHIAELGTRVTCLNTDKVAILPPFFPPKSLHTIL